MSDGLARIEAQADKDVITDLAEWAEARAARLALNDETQSLIRLCIEEAVTNIIRHAYDDGPAHHVICVESGTENGAPCFIVSDDGRPFDPVAADEPGREGNILDATVGGRGIRLMRKFTKAMRYDRRDGRNHLTLFF